MPFYLQRVRFTVHTKAQRFAGTNSTVKLCYNIEEKHNHPELTPGIHSSVLDHPWHDDFQSGKSDSYEVSFGTGRGGKNYMGRPMLNGIQFETLEEVRAMQFALRIEGSDQWIFDRFKLGGFFMEVRPAVRLDSIAADADETEDYGVQEQEADPDPEYEEVELGWLEMARHSGDIEMSSDSDEGYQEWPIELNGSFQ